MIRASRFKGGQALSGLRTAQRIRAGRNSSSNTNRSRSDIVPELRRRRVQGQRPLRDHLDPVRLAKAAQHRLGDRGVDELVQLDADRPVLQPGDALGVEQSALAPLAIGQQGDARLGQPGQLVGRAPRPDPDPVRHAVRARQQRAEVAHLRFDVEGVHERAGQRPGKADRVVALRAADVDDMRVPGGDPLLDHREQLGLVAAEELADRVAAVELGGYSIPAKGPYRTVRPWRSRYARRGAAISRLRRETIQRSWSRLARAGSTAAAIRRGRLAGNLCAPFPPRVR